MSRTPQFGFHHYTKSCLETHTGLWCVDDAWALQFLQFLQSGMMQAYLAQSGPIAPVVAQDYEKGYDLYGDMAMVPLVGSLSPKGSKWGGGSTLAFRRGLRAASRDPQVKTVMAYINSPGGVVEGTYEAARDLRQVGDVKATHAHIQDLGASAAYWIGSQAHRLTANPPAFVGNIGVRSAIVDTSKMFEMEGAKVHLLSTGPFKAIGVPGVEVTKDQIAHFQGLVNQTFELFRDDVAFGRGLDGKRLDAVLTGKTYMASDALSVGLIDEVVDVETLIPTGDSGMTEQVADVGAFRKFLSEFKLRVVPEASVEAIPGQAEEFEARPEPARPLRTYEQGVQAGVDLARAEAIEIMEICLIGDKRDGLNTARAALMAGLTPKEVREELAGEIALRGNRGAEGEEIGEINTAHVAPVKKPAPVLRSAMEVASERDRMAANYNGGAR